MLPLDPECDASRKAWIPCPKCFRPDCFDCNNFRNCSQHWVFLVGNRGRVVTLQCPECAHMWSLRGAA